MAIADAPVVPDVYTDELEVQRDRLLGKLAVQRAYARKMWDWYRGRQDLPAIPTRYEQAYRLLLDRSPTPWARLVVDTISERLRVTGIQSLVHEDAATEAWEVFMRSRMNADQRLVYTESLVCGVGYVSVALLDGGDVDLAPESAFEVTHEDEPGDRRTTAAALKLYPADWTRRHWRCELFRPEATYRWEAFTSGTRNRDEGAFPIDGRRARDPLGWEYEDVVRNVTGRVPIVPFENRFDVLSGGVSEIEDLIPILQRIDKLTLDELLTSDVAAFRQKWATGLQVPDDPETGKPIEPFKSAVDRLWVSDLAETRFGTFEASDLTPYLTAKDAEIATLAAISRVPAHFLMQRNLANPPTAESLIAGESGLVAKVEDHQTQFGERWEQVSWLALTFAGHEHELGVEDLEVQWANAERRNPAQVADTATKLRSVDVPDWAVWEYLGFTPDEIARFSEESAAAQLLAAAALPTPTPEVPAAG